MARETQGYAHGFPPNFLFDQLDRFGCSVEGTPIVLAVWSGWLAPNFVLPATAWVAKTVVVIMIQADMVTVQ
jgi:hypothetical protein